MRPITYSVSACKRREMLSMREIATRSEVERDNFSWLVTLAAVFGAVLALSVAS